MLAGAETERTAIVAEGIAGRAADLREGRAGPCDLKAVDDEPGAIAIDEMKGVAAVGGDIDESVPRRCVARESLSAGVQIRRLARENEVLLGQVGQFNPGAGIDLPS